MGNFYYTRPSDDLAPTVTPTIVSGALVSGYGVDKLTDGDVGVPLIATGTSLRLQWDFGSAVLPVLPVLLHSNLTVAATFEGSATGSWPGSDIYTFGVPSTYRDGFKTNVYLDLTGQTARRYWSLNIAANGANIRIGEIVLSSARRQPSHPPTKPINFERFRPTHTLSTDGATRRGVRIGPRIDQIKCNVQTTRAALYSEWDEWHADADGNIKPFIVLVDSDETHARYVTFTDASLPWFGLSRDWVQVSVSLTEVSPGLRHPS